MILCPHPVSCWCCALLLVAIVAASGQRYSIESGTTAYGNQGYDGQGYDSEAVVSTATGTNYGQGYNNEATVNASYGQGYGIAVSRPEYATQTPIPTPTPYIPTWPPVTSVPMPTMYSPTWPPVTASSAVYATLSPTPAPPAMVFSPAPYPMPPFATQAPSAPAYNYDEASEAQQATAAVADQNYDTNGASSGAITSSDQGYSSSSIQYDSGQSIACREGSAAAISTAEGDTGISHAYAGAEIQLEVFYGPRCPHCVEFVAQALMPLLEAQLPGNQVQLTILPWLPGERAPGDCLVDKTCLYGLAPACALAANTPKPMGFDSERLRRNVKFVFCYLSHVAAGSILGYTKDTLEDCAHTTGITWCGDAGLQACATGNLAYDIVNGIDFQSKMRAVQARLRSVKAMNAPFVFLNGDILICSTPTWCESIRTVIGDIPLHDPGSLLYVVCSKLQHQPEACYNVQNTKRPKKRDVQKQIKECENCAEVGTFTWDRAWDQRQQTPLLLLATFAAMACMAAYILIRARHWRTSQGFELQGDTSTSGLDA